MRVRPVDRVAQQGDQSRLWCDLEQAQRRPWVKEGVGRRFASDDARRELRRKLSKVPVWTTFVAVRDEVQLLVSCGHHLWMGTQVRMKRRRAAALRANDDEIWCRNHSVAGARDTRVNHSPSPESGDFERFAVRQDHLDSHPPVL